MKGGGVWSSDGFRIGRRGGGDFRFCLCCGKGVCVCVCEIMDANGIGSRV